MRVEVNFELCVLLFLISAQTVCFQWLDHSPSHQQCAALHIFNGFSTLNPF